jgi:amino acid transporter
LFSFFLLLKEVRTLSKIQKVIAMLLIIAAVVFVAGCATHPKTMNTKEQTVSSFPTENDIQWMQTTYNNSDMFLLFANEMNDILNGKQEMNAQRLLFCAGEATG